MKIKRIIILSVLIVISGGISMGIFWRKGQKVTLNDIEKKVGMDLSKDMVLKSLESYEEDGENHAGTKLLINKDITKLQADLEQKYGRNLINTGYNYPQYKSLNLWAEVQNGEIKALYEKMTSGNRAKTVIIDIFIVEDKKEDKYLYIFY